MEWAQTTIFRNHHSRNIGKGETLKSKYEIKVHAPKVAQVEEVVAEAVVEAPVKKTRKKKD